MDQKERDDYIALGWTGDGWLPLIKLIDCYIAGYDPNYSILQIKEKFGGLRYYYSSTKTEESYAFVTLLTSLSTSICENCGVVDNNIVVSGSWLKAYCDKCRKEAK
jgi:hypothetical protein